MRFRVIRANNETIHIFNMDNIHLLCQWAESPRSILICCGRTLSVGDMRAWIQRSCYYV